MRYGIRTPAATDRLSKPERLEPLVRFAQTRLHEVVTQRAGLGLFGAAVGGVLAEATDIRMTFFIIAILMSVLVIVGWVSPLRDSNLK